MQKDRVCMHHHSVGPDIFNCLPKSAPAAGFYTGGSTVDADDYFLQRGCSDKKVDLSESSWKLLYVGGR
jgi:hypothetical protein